MSTEDIVFIVFFWVVGIFIIIGSRGPNQEVKLTTYTCTTEQADKITEICSKKAAIGHCYERQTELRCKKDD